MFSTYTEQVKHTINVIKGTCCQHIQGNTHGYYQSIISHLQKTKDVHIYNFFLHGISTMLKSTKTAVPESIKHGEQSCMYPLKLSQIV